MIFIFEKPAQKIKILVVNTSFFLYNRENKWLNGINKEFIGRGDSNDSIKA